MNWRFTEEQEMLRRVVADFVAKEIAPIADECDRREEFPLYLMSRMGELGLFAVNCPEEYGGVGASMVNSCIVIEELAYGDAGIALSAFAQLFLAVPPLWRWGTEDQKERYLRPAVEGRKIGALAVTEPNAGSDVAGIQTRAEKRGYHYLLNGAKMFATNGTIADYIIVAASTDRSKGVKGISLFIVDSGASGLTRKKLNKMGCRSSDTAVLFLEDCPVPAENLLGSEEGGFYNVMRTFDGERVATAAFSVGLARAAFDAALKYANERMQFGRPIGKFQVVAHALADMLKEIEVAKAITYRVASMIDEETDCRKEAAIAKLYASEMVNRVAYQALQIHGGYGMMLEYPVNRYFRDARQLEIGAGTSEIMREIIAASIGFRTR